MGYYLSKLDNLFLQMQDVTLGSECEIVGRCPGAPFTLCAMKYTWHQNRQTWQPPPQPPLLHVRRVMFVIYMHLGQADVWGSAWDLSIISSGDNISHITQTSFLFSRWSEEPGETLIAAEKALEPKWPWLALAMVLLPFPWKREVSLFDVWMDVPTNHTCALMTPNLQGPRAGPENILLPALKNIFLSALFLASDFWKDTAEDLLPRKEAGWRAGYLFVKVFFFNCLFIY